MEDGDDGVAEEGGTLDDGVGVTEEGFGGVGGEEDGVFGDDDDDEGGGLDGPDVSFGVVVVGMDDVD